MTRADVIIDLIDSRTETLDRFTEIKKSNNTVNGIMLAISIVCTIIVAAAAE